MISWSIFILLVVGLASCGPGPGQHSSAPPPSSASMTANLTRRSSSAPVASDQASSASGDLGATASDGASAEDWPEQPNIPTHGVKADEWSDIGMLVSIRLSLEAYGHVAQMYASMPYVSDDGKFLALIHRHEPPRGKAEEVRLLVYDTITGSVVHELPLWEPKMCSGVSHGLCKERMLRAVATPNALFAKQKWFMARSWFVDPRPEGSFRASATCAGSMAPTFKIGRYSFSYHPPRVRIEREGAGVLSDTKLELPIKSAGGCKDIGSPSVDRVIIEERFGFIALILVRCVAENCPEERHVMMLRLPSDGVRSNPEVSTKTFVPPPPPPEVHKESDSGGF